MQVISIPADLNYRSVDDLLDAAAAVEHGRALMDGRHLRWVDPAGMVGLLAAGSILRDRLGAPVRLEPPERADVAGYLARMGFFHQAEGVFDVPARPRRGEGSSDVLLEITPVRANLDVHEAVDRVQKRAGAILSSRLGYPATAVVPFSVILSEVCQNIIEHAEGPGWVAAQAYQWTKRLGRWVLVLAVMDVGRGFRGSLADEHAARYGDRWSDGTALEAAFLHGLTRFVDSGRGQGIQQIRRQVQRWDGTISIRSGSARITQPGSWDDAPPMVEGLAPCPGAQITILLPGGEAS